MSRIMFFCQNFLGLGHLARTTTILRRLAPRAETCLVFGGQQPPRWEIPPETRVVNLPALRREAGALLVVDDPRDLETIKAIRSRQLRAIFDDFDPDVLVTEGFPFSKRALAFELVPLLEYVRRRPRPPRVMCSLRDIIMAKRADVSPAKALRRAHKERATVEWLHRFYDGVLIHADPRIFRLGERFSRAAELQHLVRYTGYVVQEEPAATVHDPDLDPAQPTILVSVGGGRLGHTLLDSLMGTAPALATTLPRHRVLVFTGPFMPDPVFADLQAKARHQPNVVLRRFTPDLIAQMRAADLSISLFGYNTAMNVLRTGVRALTLPSGKDLEQPLRARRFAEHGLVEVIERDGLVPERLYRRIVSALARPHTRPAIDFDLDGAQRTADLLARAAHAPTRDASIGARIDAPRLH